MKQIITSNKTIIAAALLTLGLTGCAITPATESINYQAQTGVAHVAHAENVTVNVVTTDSRADKLISHKKNGYGMKMAGIKSDEPVSLIVNKAIEQELKSRGFSMSQNSGLKITANITKFYDEFDGFMAYAAEHAEANMEITVKKDSSVIYQKNLNGTFDDKWLAMAGGSQAKDALEKALANAMTELFNDPAFIAALTTAAPTQAAPAQAAAN